MGEAERSLKSAIGIQLVKKANEAKDEFSKNIFRKKLLDFISTTFIVGSADFPIFALELLLYLLPNNKKKGMIKPSNA